ncbi:hypothetical protein DPMN_033598 [Dreissena polymorpha]|uniref:Uncharacterized protein n=1 Tax=Dreissena polymorpha TaxID=45954 RepID=A0A9D3YZY0_DREPO|nr:hypothetical protein DPMN_068823 [Dreissena polymorpha]KAH3709372.1 hypothetical protein DPMN_068834 [Dreissena polymorpha]KAH3870412.1 hypothetical protein DPMN_033598 [Dreissena polymorpha]
MITFSCVFYLDNKDDDGVVDDDNAGDGDNMKITANKLCEHQYGTIRPSGRQYKLSRHASVCLSKCGLN